MRRRYGIPMLLLCAVTALHVRAAARPGPTIEELTERVEVQKTEKGGTITLRTFREGTTWESYLAAVRAEENDALAAELGDALAATTTLSCTPPDDDYDGDGYVGAADPSPWVAQRPVVRTEFPIDIEPYIAVELTSTGEIVEENKHLDSSSVEHKYTVTDTLEMKRVFNSTLGLKLKFGLRGFLPTVDLESAGLDATQTFTRTSTTEWKDVVTETMKSEFSRTYTETLRSQKRLVPNAGGVRTNLLLINDSDVIIGRPTNIEVSQVRLSFVAIHPLTGAIDPIGEMTIDETFQLYEGPGVNTWTKFVDLTGRNTEEMLRHLRQGFVFDIAIASHPVAIDLATGQDIRLTLANINNRSVNYSITFGEEHVDRRWGAVSSWVEGGRCLTARDLLEAAVGPSNVEFDRRDDGALIVASIDGYANSNTDFDQALCEADPDYFSRWIVGYDWGNIHGGDEEIDLEHSILRPGDQVHFYRLTCSDMLERRPGPDLEIQDAVVRNDDAARRQLDGVADLLEGDRVQLVVENAFKIDRVVSQYTGASRVCYAVPPVRLFYNITERNRQPWIDSLFDLDHPIPNIDYYGLEVRFNGGSWMPMSTLLSVPGIGARVLAPDDPWLARPLGPYEFAVEFEATDALFGELSTSELDIRSVRPRDTHTVGFTGGSLYDPTDECLWSEVSGFMQNVVGVRIFRYGGDDDLDQFFADFADFDDADPRRFAFAPEHLDGVDNDGDAEVDEEPLLCPSALHAGETGTCTLDDRMGWYEAPLHTEMQVRTLYEDGTASGWQFLPGQSAVTITMPADPAVDGLEIYSSNWVDLPPPGGTNFVRQLDPNDPVVRQVGATIEAEDGVVIYPMIAEYGAGETFVHVPLGTTDTTGARADFAVQIPVAGDYEIWTNVYATDASDDSFVVDVLDPGGQRVDFGFGDTAAHFRFERALPDYGYGSYGWTRVGHWNAYVTPNQERNPVVYHLGPGVHTIRFRPRELGARLDKLRVARVCRDTDGDGVTDCAGDCNDANAQVYPGRGELCSTAHDDDCDGVAQEGCSPGGGCRGCNYEQP